MAGPAADNGHPPRRGAPPRVVIGVLADEETRATLSQAATRRAIPFAFELGGIEEALAGLHPDETADCVIVDLDGTPDAIDDVAVLATGLPRYAELILLGIFSEEQVYELTQAGATLCLSKPLSEAAVSRILGHAPVVKPRPQPAPQPAPQPLPPPAVAREPVPAIYEQRREPPPVPAIYEERREPPTPPELQPALEQPVELPAQPPPQQFAAPPPAPPQPAPQPYTPPAEEVRRHAYQLQTEEPAPARSPAHRFNPAEAPPSYGHQQAARPGRSQGRVMSVVGCRGGVGASSVAVGLAWLLAEEMSRNTLLLDLDPYFGSIALALNLDPGDALQQALERPTRIDAVFLDRAVRKFGQNLFVLCSEQSLEQPARLDPAGPATLIKSLCTRHERLVIDLPRGDPDIMLRVLSLSDEIILVTDLSLAGARDAMRLMSLVRGAASYARVRIVGGGARDSAKSPVLSPSEFRRAVGAAIDITIAWDGETAGDAARSGRPIPKVFPRSAATKALRNLAQSLESNEPREQKRRLLFWKK